MNIKKISVSQLFRFMWIGFSAAVPVLCCITFLLTRQISCMLVCALTAAVSALWVFILMHIIQQQLAAFTNDVCRTIDAMMEREPVSAQIFDEDTLLDRINHELHRLYQMLQAEKNTIAEQQKDLQQLISDISHQVKTPITNLKMTAAALEEMPLPHNQQSEYLQSLNRQLDKLDFLMESMVKSSRLEAGVILLEKQPASVYETLAAALGGIFQRAEKKKLQVLVNCPENLTIPHDSKWTSEALFNILENAVKYTPDYGKIQVSVVQWEAYVKIDIVDNGRGIPESRHGAVFKRFYREPEVHSSEGIGIGLYLARQIIRRQEGFIKLTSAPGAGSAFSVFLPVLQH